MRINCKIENPANLVWINEYLKCWSRISFPDKRYIDNFRMPFNVEHIIEVFGIKTHSGYIDMKDVPFVTSYYKRYFLEHYKELEPDVIESDINVELYYEGHVHKITKFEESYGLTPDKRRDGQFQTIE